MGEQDKEPEPRELVEALREKLQNAHLSRHELERLVPPSLAKRDQHSIPPYEPGQYKKQCEETRKRMEKLEAQRLPAFVSKKVQDKFLNEFYELKAQGKLSHLSPEQLEKLEAEIKASAANSKKHAELQEFLASLSRGTAIPEQQSTDKCNGVPTENDLNTSQGSQSVNDTSTSEGDQGANREKKPSIVKVRMHDGSHVECFAILTSQSLCLTAIPTQNRDKPKERKAPVNVPSRNVQEILDAMSIITDYIQHESDLAKYLEDLKELEKILKQRV